MEKYKIDFMRIGHGGLKEQVEVMDKSETKNLVAGEYFDQTINDFIEIKFKKFFFSLQKNLEKRVFYFFLLK